MEPGCHSGASRAGKASKAGGVCLAGGAGGSFKFAHDIKRPIVVRLNQPNRLAQHSACSVPDVAAFRSDCSHVGLRLVALVYGLSVKGYGCGCFPIGVLGIGIGFCGVMV